MQQRLKTLGTLGIGFGVLAAILVFIPPYGFFLALPLGFLGMLISTAYVYFDSKYQVNTKKLTPGIIGIFLSSIPIVLVMILIVMSKK